MECPKCNSENYQYVRKDWESGSGFNINRQCMNCGYADCSRHFPHTVEYLGMFNIELNDEYYRKESERFRSEQSEKRTFELQQWHNENDPYYKSEKWRRKRDYVLKRDSYLCQMCLTNRAIDVHHTTYIHFGNELTSELISVCRGCHNVIHDKETPF